LAFCRANSDDVKPLARAFGVESIPTLIVIRDHIMLAEEPGYLSESAFDDLLQQVTTLDMDAVRSDIAAPAAESEEE
jgi:thioredoxin-like negative regulator of GroEL